MTDPVTAPAQARDGRRSARCRSKSKYGRCGLPQFHLDPTHVVPIGPDTGFQYGRNVWPQYVFHVNWEAIR